eukprot:SAG31_NODE_1313_length_8853_cov_60.435458_9_plen_78_part_00
MDAALRHRGAPHTLGGVENEDPPKEREQRAWHAPPQSAIGGDGKGSRQLTSYLAGEALIVLSKGPGLGRAQRTNHAH